MKQKIILLIAGIVLFAFISFASIMWYRLFYTQEAKDISIFQVGQDKEDKSTVNTSDMYPMDDEIGATVQPYHFTVKNNGTTNKIYKVLIEEATLSDDPQYQSKNLLSRTQLNYQLTLNNRVIKVGKLSDIKNNILDERSIESEKENQYQLRVYVNKDALQTDWVNKYYHYKINIQMKEN